MRRVTASRVAAACAGGAAIGGSRLTPAEAVSQADALALAAAAKIAAGIEDMRQAARILESTADYKVAVRGRKGIMPRKEWETYASYRHSSIASLIHDGELVDVPRLLRSDVQNDRRNMAEAIAEDERDRRRFAVRKAA